MLLRDRQTASTATDSIQMTFEAIIMSSPTLMRLIVSRDGYSMIFALASFQYTGIQHLLLPSRLTLVWMAKENAELSA